MKNTVFTTEITIIVKSIDLKSKTCNLDISFNGSNVVELVGVNVSGLLLWKFGNDSNYVVGNSYTCTIASTDWLAMPFQLICYGSVEDPQYLLECVNVRKSTKLISKDVLGNTLIDYKSNYYKAKDYRRYRNYVGLVRE